MRFFEIARIPQGDFGDKDTLLPMPDKPKTKPLPGGSQFSYAVNKKDPEFMEIMIFDNDTLVGELDLGATLDPLKTWLSCQPSTSKAINMSLPSSMRSLMR